MRRIIAALDPHARHWLDFGCGNAALVRDVAATSTIAIAGFDTGAWANRARRDGIAVLTEAELKERSGHFDVVTAIEVIEHLVEPVPFLRQLRNALRPGGRLFITTGNAACAPRDFCTWSYVAPEIHVSYFTPRALALALEAAGFQPEFPGYVDGFTDMIRFKILKSLRQRRHRFWHDLVPWPVLSRLADRRYGISTLPSGRAV